MRLDGEPAIGRLHVVAAADAGCLAGVGAAVVQTRDVFDDGIGKGELEGAVAKGQASAVGDDPVDSRGRFGGRFVLSLPLEDRGENE